MGGNGAHRRGMIYSLSIFLMLGALVALAGLWLTAADRREQALGAPTDAEVLNFRLSELKWLALQQMGLNATLSRNGTGRLITVGDAGFPLTNSANGRANTGGLGPWLSANWPNVTNASLSMDSSGPAADGVLLRTASGMAYSQDNSNGAYDITYLTLGGQTPQSINLSIRCTAPAGAANLTFSENSPGLGTTVRVLRFSSSGAYNATNTTHDADSTPFGAAYNKTFYASYLDSGRNWMQSIHADWINSGGGYVQVWSEINSSYPGMSKGLVNCSWSERVMVSDSGAGEDRLWIPIPIAIAYGDANYSGNLTLARD
ncbi:Uncharacterised protein [uncultured archaeon]|nr:Uncharacterised protein [uncultured archaeon]